MTIIKTFYKKWKNPAISSSLSYLIVSIIFIFLFNYIFTLNTGNPFSDFLFDLILGISFAVTSAFVIYLILQKNLNKINKISSENIGLLKKLKLQFENMPAGIVIVDTSFDITDWNPSAEKIFGYKKSETLGRNANDLIVSDSFKSNLAKIIRKIKTTGESVEIIHENITNTGKKIDCHWHITPLFDEENNYFGAMGMVLDITEKIKIEEDHRKLLSAVQHNPASIVITNIEGILEYANPKTMEITGYEEAELVGQRPELMFQSEFVTKQTNKEIFESLSEGKTWKGELLNKKKSGELYWANVTIVPISNSRGKISHFIGIEEDITDKKITHEQLRHSLEEKELMLREIHHRVKNNLQVISSLLSMQASHIKEPEARNSFNISRDRVKSMSLVHEQLYRTSDMTRINFEEYINMLTAHLLDSYGEHGGRIKVNTKACNIKFGIDTAIPCGLIINELLVNSLKHAFPGNKEGEINIEIVSLGEGKYTLTISDNGIGLPKNYESLKNNSLGMQLVEALTIQLDGKMLITNGKGSKFEISFKEAKYKKRINLEEYKSGEKSLSSNLVISEAV